MACLGHDQSYFCTSTKAPGMGLSSAQQGLVGEVTANLQGPATEVTFVYLLTGEVVFSLGLGMFWVPCLHSHLQPCSFPQIKHSNRSQGKVKCIDLTDMICKLCGEASFLARNAKLITSLLE